MDSFDAVALGVSLIVMSTTMVTGLVALLIARTILQGRLVVSSQASATAAGPALQGPPKVAGWLRSPTVLVHDSCPVPNVVVESAIHYWRSMGHKIGPITRTSDPSGVRGAILLMGKRAALGRTSVVTRISDHGQRWVDPVDLSTVKRGDHYCLLDEVASVYNDGQIDHAVIMVPPAIAGMNMDLLVIHMLGHALGYAHAGAVRAGREPVFRKGHVMTGLLSEAGWSNDGLQA